MITTIPGFRILTVAALLAGTALMAGCASEPVKTTTTSQTSTTTTPPPAPSSTTTTTTINRSSTSPAP